MRYDCLACGACCAFSKYWPALRPNDPGDGAEIPVAFLDVRNRRMRCVGDRCSALEGSLGLRVSCRVYEVRPQACRVFTVGGPGCRLARGEE